MLTPPNKKFIAQLLNRRPSGARDGSRPCVARIKVAVVSYRDIEVRVSPGELSKLRRLASNKPPTITTIL